MCNAYSANSWTVQNQYCDNTHDMNLDQLWYYLQSETARNHLDSFYRSKHTICYSNTLNIPKDFLLPWVLSTHLLRKAQRGKKIKWRKHLITRKDIKVTSYNCWALDYQSIEAYWGACEWAWNGNSQDAKYHFLQMFLGLKRVNS